MATLMAFQAALAKSNLSMESFGHQKEDFIVWCEVRRMLATTETCSSR